MTGVQTCALPIFEALELIRILLKVIFLHEVLCSSFHVVHVSNGMRQLDPSALEHLFVWKFKSTIGANSNLLGGSGVLLGHVKRLKIVLGIQLFPSYYQFGDFGDYKYFIIIHSSFFMFDPGIDL